MPGTAEPCPSGWPARFPHRWPPRPPGPAGPPPRASWSRSGSPPRPGGQPRRGDGFDEGLRVLLAVVRQGSDGSRRHAGRGRAAFRQPAVRRRESSSPKPAGRALIAPRPRHFRPPARKARLCRIAGGVLALGPVRLQRADVDEDPRGHRQHRQRGEGGGAATARCRQRKPPPHGPGDAGHAHRVDRQQPRHPAVGPGAQAVHSATGQHA